MKKIVIYESWKDNRKFTKAQIRKIYKVKETFDYYCDYIKSRMSTDNRKELNRLKNDIKNNEVSIVLIQSLNHISRDMQMVFSFMELASKNNCEVIDINGFNYTNFYKHFKEGIQQTIDKKKKIVLEVSEEYNVNFDAKIPFEYFDIDNGGYNMSSFSNYYKEIFEKLNINFDNISTKEISDGKYELNLDNNILDIRAWDTLEDVIDNVESALSFYNDRNKDKEMEVL